MSRYKINEIYNQQYYQVPKEFYHNKKYFSLSSDAILLYSILRDRMELSRINNWVNSNGEIYLIYTRDNLCDLMRKSKPTIVKAFKQLKIAKLIEEEYLGKNRPNLIYICHLSLETLKNLGGKHYLPSGGKHSLPHEVKKLYPNKTDSNKTNFNKYIPQHNNFEQREYTEEDYEKFYSNGK